MSDFKDRQGNIDKEGYEREINSLRLDLRGTKAEKKALADKVEKIER